MRTITGIQYPVEFQHGIILRGNSETLIPIAKLSSGIQWHCVRAEDTRPFLEVIESYPQWYQSQNWQELTGSRTFLGYCSHCQVRLGTARSDVRPCELDLDRKWIGIENEIPINVNLKLPSIASIGATLKIILPKSQWNQIKCKEIGYQESVQRSRRTPLLFYDFGTRTGWLVPELSLVLHLALANLENLRPQPNCFKKLHYAKALADGGSAALAAIQSCEDVVLWKQKENDDKPFRFLDLIWHYLHVLENRRTEQQLKNDACELSAFIGLRGWDFTDLKDNTYHFAPRVLPAPRLSNPSWWKLAKDFRTLVVFGRNLEQIIGFDRTKIRACSVWQTVPPDRELLVATVPCVRELARNFEASLPNYKLATDIMWHRPKSSTLFEECLGSCNPIQKARDLGPLATIRRPFRPVRNPGDLEDEGAVIFGTRKSVKDLINARCHPLELQAPEQWLVGISFPTEKHNLLSLALVLLCSACIPILIHIWMGESANTSLQVLPLSNASPFYFLGQTIEDC